MTNSYVFLLTRRGGRSKWSLLWPRSEIRSHIFEDGDAEFHTTSPEQFDSSDPEIGSHHSHIVTSCAFI